ncbi:unnamed protein product [Leptosia nina]|uniref:Regulatory protein zeste n=1 Tax=Leptosia nina TaxID=320188 RepID=A0AAV1K202_9NEOP
MSKIKIINKNKGKEEWKKGKENAICKRNESFSNLDAQRLWQSIAKECNAIPGAKKHWRQWKKTWQDMRSKYAKRRRSSNNGVPSISGLLTEEEREVLFGVKMAEEYSENTEFVPLNDNQESFHDENTSACSISEPPSPQEVKVFHTQKPKLRSDYKNKCYKNSSEPSGNCSMSCDMLVTNEQKKIKLKEDFMNFKKDYLRQKLRLLKEQTEALKSIAREICNK